MRTSGKTNNTPGWPNLHRTGPGGKKEKHKKEEPKLALSISLSHVLGHSSLHVFGSTCPRASKMDFLAII